jgi:hypothetical protein
VKVAAEFATPVLEHVSRANVAGVTATEAVAGELPPPPPPQPTRAMVRTAPATAVSFIIIITFVSEDDLLYPIIRLMYTDYRFIFDCF